MESGRVDAVGGGDLPDGPTLTTKSHGPPEVELDPGPAELGATPLGSLEPGLNPLPAPLPFQLGTAVMIANESLPTGMLVLMPSCVDMKSMPLARKSSSAITRWRTDRA